MQPNARNQGGTAWVHRPLEVNALLREIPIAEEGDTYRCGCRWDAARGWLPCMRSMHRLFAAHDPDWDALKRFVTLRATLRAVEERMVAAGHRTQIFADVTGGLRMVVDNRPSPFLELFNEGSAEMPRVVLRAVRTRGMV